MLIRGGERNVVYTRLQRILRDECPPPGNTLRDLAAIPAFNLYLTTTFDPLLQRALDDARFGGQALTQVCSFFPKRRKKTCPPAAPTSPARRSTTSWGKSRPARSSSPGEGRAGIHLRPPAAHHHHGDGTPRARFEGARPARAGAEFLRLAGAFLFAHRQAVAPVERRPHTEYLAEGPSERLSQAMVLFFSNVTRNVTVVQRHPAEFAAELSRRWREKHPMPAAPIPGAQPRTTASPGGGNAARGHLYFLRPRGRGGGPAPQGRAGSRGCEVWYDRERLRPGGHWHNSLVDEVKGRCALFLSVISRTTESTPTSYYHQERNWAQEYYGMFAQGRVMDEFYVPVVIDDSPLPAQREPRVFTTIQATRLPGGEAPAAFGDWLRILQEKRRALLFPPTS